MKKSRPKLAKRLVLHHRAHVSWPLGDSSLYHLWIGSCLVKSPLKSLCPLQVALEQGSGGGGNIWADSFMAAGYLLELSNSEHNLGGKIPQLWGWNAENRPVHVKHGLNALYWPPLLNFIRTIIIIMKSWDDNNKSFEMLPKLHIAGFRRQWAAAWLNVAPSCQGETHPDTGETNQQGCAGYTQGRATWRWSFQFRLDTIAIHS